MSGIISSAQARELISDAVPLKIPDNTVSSHDLLREEVQVEQTQVPVVEESAPEPVIAASQPEPVKQESPNFRQLRQKAEAAEREAREKDEIIQRLLRQSQQPQVQQQQESSNLDEILERKHLDPVEKKLNDLERRYAQLEQRNYLERSRHNLQSKYNDYEKVMSEDNLKDLEYMNPSVANALKTTNDLEGAQTIAYHMIKAMGIYQPESQGVSIEADKKRVAENMAKPKPANVIGKSNSPLGSLSPYHREQTKEHKELLWKKMQQKMRAKKSF